jgi:hypothetical protein
MRLLDINYILSLIENRYFPLIKILILIYLLIDNYLLIFILNYYTYRCLIKILLLFIYFY